MRKTQIFTFKAMECVAGTSREAPRSRPANQNRRSVPPDYSLLPELYARWGFAQQDLALWPRYLAKSLEEDARHLAVRAHALQPKMHNPDAVWTILAQSATQSLFQWIRHLPPDETIYILEEIARLTDETVINMKKGVHNEKSNA